ncbi:hypothetical protein [Paraburkholderia sp. J8-2]|uniref:hypothetical protein n=1 Tax=Paraburkholderia sp. J8-2 TaxID=2805440 RepID=UPI002AB7DD3C|nr:hypothetical protein [Paraburkholderia sp. J8-2]
MKSNHHTTNRNNQRKRAQQQGPIVALNLVIALMRLVWVITKLTAVTLYVCIAKARPIFVPIARIALRRAAKVRTGSWRLACRAGSRLHQS